MKNAICSVLFLISFESCTRNDDPASIKKEPTATNGAAPGTAGTGAQLPAAGGSQSSAGASSSKGGSAGGQGGAQASAGHPTRPIPPDNPRCPASLPGPRMVEIPTSDHTSSYCIDSTEVTQAQYEEFLVSARKTPPIQGELCKDNTDLGPVQQDVYEGSPTAGNGQCPKELYDPVGKAYLPVSCVDWCDAAAYCAWAGKRLCGKVGGGEAAFDKTADATESQWYNACSQGGKTRYPYGDEENKNICAVSGSPLTKGERPALDADSAPECHGQAPPFSFVTNLAGNVGEWEDSCAFYAPGQSRYCHIRFGGWVIPTEWCGSDSAVPPVTASGSIGFRCCKD